MTATLDIRTLEANLSTCKAEIRELEEEFDCLERAWDRGEYVAPRMKQNRQELRDASDRWNAAAKAFAAAGATQAQIWFCK